jgi:hypothetical protein
MLEMCEMTSGKALFDPRTNGVGFTDPLHVTHPELAPLRWRPWYTGAEEQRQREALAIDAMIYAMLQPTDDLAALLGKLGWTLPLFEIGKTKITFARADFLFEKGKRRDNPQCPWHAGEVVEKSLVKVQELLDGLTGQGPHPEADTGQRWRDAILAEAGRFWSEVSQKVGFGPGTDKRRELLEYQQKLLSDRKKAARGGNKPVLEQMIARLADHLA